MLTEDHVPLVDRWLLLTSRASKRAVRAVEGGLPKAWPATARCVFVNHSYADLPVGKTFEVVFPEDRPLAAVDAKCRILAVTQQYAAPWGQVPHGWKTLCVLDFPDGVPALLETLPERNGWDGVGVGICISSRATLESLRQHAALRLHREQSPAISAMM